MAGHNDGGNTMAREIEPYVNEDGEVMIAGPTAAKLAQLLERVPVDDENANVRIAERLMSAGSVLDLNRPWEATSGREVAAQLLPPDPVHQRPSRFQNGLRIFLVAEGENMADGRELVMTTSAAATVIQLARAAASGWLPAYCTVEVADKPTDRGFYPYHLRFVPPPNGGAK
jgi:hypothetical protein